MRQKSISIFLVAFVALFLLARVVSWAGSSGESPFDYARITDVDYKAEVIDEEGGNGKIIVTERLTFDIHAASKSNLFWELWRALPEMTVDGVKVTYKVNSVKQILSDGTPVEYGESPRLYWNDSDFTNTSGGRGPGKWYHSPGPYNEALRLYECVLFYVDGLYRETVVFEIEYEMYNAALRYNDCSELYISLYSGNDVNYLQSFKGQILLPNSLMPKPGNYTSNTYGTNANEFAFTESDSANPGYHTFMFELDETQLKFKPYNQYIEFTLVAFGEDKHIFTQHASPNYYYYDDVLDEIKTEQAKYQAEPAKYMVAKIVVFVLLLAVSLWVLFATLGTHKKMQKKHTFYQPRMQFEYFRDIPSQLDPNFAAALFFCKHKQPKDTQDGYAAIMLSLVRKGYFDLVKIKEEGNWDFNNVKIIVKYNPAVPAQANIPRLPLTQTEEQYCNLILRHANGADLPLSTFQQRLSTDYENTNFFLSKIKNATVNIGMSQGYFQKVDYTQPVKQLKNQAIGFGFLGVLITVACNLISYQTRLDLAFGAFFILGFSLIARAIYLYRVAKKYVLLTQFGEDEYAKWRGLYNFLNSSTLLSERTVIELPIWEQYLIYATAFGIADKVIAAINVRCPYVEASPVLRNSYYRSSYFHVS
ncbi:DUF2207 domain-containing protein, partial [Ruminococcaceae bacterium OttesenSCG-928-A16]|nr:DUF2207 domain-containing protein [Ruminococcaceae bacterium OttesenSCG-928-A16]